MTNRNSTPSNYHEERDRCPSCGSYCNLDTDLDDKDQCNNCRPRITKSEDLLQQSQQEENDFKALALSTKSLREARLERFEENNYVQLLKESNCIVIPFDGRKIIIDTQTEEYGILDYFPKANKILIRKTNTWKAQGLKWMFNNLFPKK